MIRKLLLFFLCSSALVAQAQQKFTISGYVREKGSQETLPGVAVAVPALKTGTVTNNYGFYSLTIAADSVELLVSATGYVPQRQKLVLTQNRQLNFELGPVQLQEVVIDAEQSKKVSEETQMSKIEIPVEQIKDIPALLGEKDVLKVLQLMPGVQKGSEGSSGFYVRGGGPDQNLIILDDATVYNAYHLFGFFSLFNGDALKSVELTKGGFPARYGGRLSSVLEMQMKDGSKEKIHGEAGIGLISSRFTLEGPIIKNKASFLVSARRTYIDALIYPFLPNDEKAGYYFYDMNAKANYVLNDKNKFYLSGYFGKDKFYAVFTDGPDSKEKASMGWGNATATARWNHQWNDRLFSNTSFIFTNYRMNINFTSKDDFEDFSLKYSSGIRDYSIKHDFDFLPNPNHYLKAGIASIYHRFTPSALVVKGTTFDDTSNVKLIETYESGVYLEDDWKITSKLKANIGFRLSQFYSDKQNTFRPEPRVSARYMLKDDLSIKASYAVMNQYLHLLSNTGIGLPTDLWVPATRRAQPMHSEQYAIGAAKDWFEKKLAITVEGYYKHSTDVLGYKEGASFLLVGDPGSTDEVPWENNVTSGQAWSYGGEILIQRKYGKFTGWIGYTLSWTQLQFDSLNFGKKYYARYDRRHDLSVVGIYKANDHITVSATWVYGTGNAVTLPQAEYMAGQHEPDVNNGYGGFGQSMWFVNDYGEKNSFRMAPYHRLDFGIQFHKELKHCVRTFEVSVYNAYNRKNPFFYYINESSSGKHSLYQVSLFPIIPSVSWSWKF